MEGGQTFSFRFLNLIAVRYLLLILVGMPIAVWLLKAHPGVSLLVIIAIALVPMGLGVGLFFAKITRKETAKITAGFIDSKCYGRIPLSDVRTANSTWKLTQPNIILSLGTGKKIRYASVSNETNNKDVRELQRFIDVLTEAIDHTESVAAARLEEPADCNGSNRIQEEGIGETIPQSDQSSRQLLLIYMPIVLVISGVLIYFIMQRRTNTTPPELSAEAVQNIIKTNKDIKEKAAAFIAQYRSEHGPFYLFTNDPDGSIEYLPESLYYDYDREPEGYLAEADTLKEIMAEPDLRPWHISIRSDDRTFQMKRGAINQSNAAQTFIYFVILADDQQPDTVRTSKRFVAAIPADAAIPNIEEWMSHDPFGGYNLGLGLSALAMQPDAAFYFAARKGEGDMDEDKFKTWAKALKDLMEKRGVYSGRFIIKVID